MLKKILRMITVTWCLYGVVRLCILVNPLVFRVAKLIKPLWNQTDNFHIFIVWTTVLVVVVLAIIFYGVIQLFFDWVFNTGYDDEE